MTRVEEAAEQERPANESWRHLGFWICPACRAECEIGEELQHKPGCVRAPKEKSDDEQPPPVRP